MKRLLPALFLLLIYLPSSSFAVRVASLYEATLPVESTQSKVRVAAESKGLEQVLIKMSGRADVASTPAIQALLPKATNYVQQYAYARAPNDEDSPLHLRVKFEPSEVKRILSEAQLPIWDENRPLVAAWLAFNSGQGYSIAGSGSGSPLPPLLISAAKTRGLPIIMPLGDLQDREAVDMSDVVEENVDNLSRASERYNASAILAGTFNKQDDGRWKAEVSLRVADKDVHHWDAQADNLPSVVNLIIDYVTQSIAEEYAVKEEADLSQALMMRIEGVNSIDKYAKVLHYLQHLAPVSGVQVVSAKSSEVLFALNIVAQPSALQRAIALDHRLQPLIGSGDHENEKPLTYQWIG